MGKDAVLQRDPGFKENKLLRLVCVPGWRTGLLRDNGTSQRQTRSPHPPEMAKDLHVAEERMPLGFVVFGTSCSGLSWLPPSPSVEAGADSPELLCSRRASHLCPMALCRRHPSCLTTLPTASFIRPSWNSTGTLKDCFEKLPGNWGIAFPSLCLGGMP